jgi:hypothetical protein
MLKDKSNIVPSASRSRRSCDTATGGLPVTAWLLDSENNWVTGQVIGIDGGLGHVLARR